jgi:hypothetical protein
MHPSLLIAKETGVTKCHRLLQGMHPHGKLMLLTECTLMEFMPLRVMHPSIK